VHPSRFHATTIGRGFSSARPRKKRGGLPVISPSCRTSFAGEEQKVSDGRFRDQAAFRYWRMRPKEFRHCSVVTGTRSAEPGPVPFCCSQGPLRYFERVLFIGNIQTQGSCYHHCPMKVSDGRVG
jgi:hypothetical protein